MCMLQKNIYKGSSSDEVMLEAITKNHVCDTQIKCIYRRKREKYEYLCWSQRYQFTRYRGFF